MTGHPAYGELRTVLPVASVLLEDNPGPMTLDGTNTWLLRAPGAAESVVVDPGHLDEPHLERIASAGPVAAILLTHEHGDHADGAPWLADRTGAPVRAFAPHLCRDADPLADDEVITAAGLDLTVLHTPGHTDDSVCLLVSHDGGTAVLTGDSVLGRGTTIIMGALGDYLASLHRLAALPPAVPALPGHGPELPDTAAIAAEYLTHREARLDQVRAALTQLGPNPTPRQVVEIVYADVDPTLWPAADESVQAQLAYLNQNP